VSDKDVSATVVALVASRVPGEVLLSLYSETTTYRSTIAGRTFDGLAFSALPATAAE
jgi:hypothetical protein